MYKKLLALTLFFTLLISSIAVSSPSPPEHFSTSWSVLGVMWAISGYSGPGGTVEIPPVVGSRTVKGVGNYAFKNNKDITTVILPSYIERIDKESFDGCDNLTKLIIYNDNINFASVLGIDYAKIPSHVTIYAYEGSKGIKYAQKHNLPYVIMYRTWYFRITIPRLEEIEILQGDPGDIAIYIPELIPIEISEDDLGDVYIYIPELMPIPINQGQPGEIYITTPED